MQNFDIQPVKNELSAAIQQKIDSKTKPLGSLGMLESIGKNICLIQNTLSPQINKPTMFVCAGDHGITQEGVSPFPQEVTYQMVYNFLSGGAAINVFARQHNMALKVVDCGVNHDFEPHPELIDLKIAYGTKNFLYEPAMTNDQCWQAIQNGAQLVTDSFNNGSNMVSFGEMGIGNTTSASALLCKLGDFSTLEACGSGTGLDRDGISHKAQIIELALIKHSKATSPIDILSTFGGFEIATMAGGMLKAAELKMVILVDGFIATAALMAAHAFNTHVLDYCIAAHLSNEKAHHTMLKLLGLTPILNLGMRLGEGTGAAVAYPVIESSVRFISEMNSFEVAGVSNGVEDEIAIHHK